MSTDTGKIKITGEPTLDPQVCKFVVDRPVLSSGTYTCRSKDMARGSLLLETLFTIESISQIKVSGNTLTIAKSGSTPWPELGKEIGIVIRKAIESGEELFDPNINKTHPADDAIRKEVEELFAKEINPAIASHGGSVELADVSGGRVYLRLGGGCQGCASANQTLKYGIEKAIRERIPEVTEVIDATDHASGDNPYFQ
ncbi:MAG: NifU family protein [Candidatus Zixiibacteriota bacterium]